MEPLDAHGRTKIDEALKHWRQGGCVLDEQWFVFRLNPDAPLTEDAAAAAAAGAENAEAAVVGFVVLTQTCDIVRDCGERPFIEVCPLVEVDEDKIREIERGHRPNYAHIPGVSDRCLVADLDRVMTVEKAVVAAWDRVTGCLDDNDARRLTLALTRKRARAAFPDDFVAFVGPLKNRMSTKHDKESDEGQAKVPCARFGFRRRHPGMPVVSSSCSGSSGARISQPSKSRAGTLCSRPGWIEFPPEGASPRYSVQC